jgi:hypothetical protein
MRGRDMKYFTIGENSQFFKASSIESPTKVQIRLRECLNSTQTFFKKEQSRKR